MHAHERNARSPGAVHPSRFRSSPAATAPLCAPTRQRRCAPRCRRAVPRNPSGAALRPPRCSNPRSSRSWPARPARSGSTTRAKTLQVNAHIVRVSGLSQGSAAARAGRRRRRLRRPRRHARRAAGARSEDARERADPRSHVHARAGRPCARARRRRFPRAGRSRAEPPLRRGRLRSPVLEVVRRVRRAGAHVLRVEHALPD